MSSLAVFEAAIRV